MSFDLTNKNIQDTFQNLLQKTGSEGHLYDLVGNQIDNLTIGGTLTAHSYVTSESIVNTSSGSTAFGNSLDDSHTFQGSITASGNISASGDLFVKHVILGSGGGSINGVGGGISFGTPGDDHGFMYDDGTNLLLGYNDFDAVKIHDTGTVLEVEGSTRIDGNLQTTSHITASGNISSSGAVIAKNATITTELHMDSAHIRFGPYTEDGILLQNPSQGLFTISNPDDSSEHYLEVNSTAVTLAGGSQYLDIKGTTDATNATGDTGILRVEGGASIAKKVFVGTDLSVGNDITASGDISASGKVITSQVGDGNDNLTLRADNVTIQTDTNGDITFKEGVATRFKYNGTDDEFEFSKGLDVTGNITASGTINASSVQANGTSVVTNVVTTATQGSFNQIKGGFAGVVQLADLGTTGNPKFNHITASGNISASGVIQGGSLDINGNADFGDGNITNVSDIALDSISADVNSNTQISVNNADITVDVDGNAVLELIPTKVTVGDTAALGLFVDTHITASGNISSSGDIFANSGSFNYITASKIDVDASTIRIGGEELSRANLLTLRQGKTLKSVGAGKVNPDLLADDGVFTGNITVSGDIFNTVNVQMTNSSSVINTFNTGSHQTCKYTLEVTSGSHIQSSEMLVVQNSSNAFNTEYAQINSSVNLLDFTSKVNGSNVELIGSSSFISCSVKFVRTLI